jgi:hypothetical protein
VVHQRHGDAGLWVTTVQLRSAGKADHRRGGGAAIDNHHLSRLDQAAAAGDRLLEAICTLLRVSIGAMAAETGNAPPWTRCSFLPPPARADRGEWSPQRR